MNGVKVRLFGKKYCGICLDVHYRIKKLQPILKFELESVDIELTENKQYLRQYYHDIPVIHMNGKEVMRHGLDEEAFKSAIEHEKNKTVIGP